MVVLYQNLPWKCLVILGVGLRALASRQILFHEAKSLGPVDYVLHEFHKLHNFLLLTDINFKIFLTTKLSISDIAYNSIFSEILSYLCTNFCCVKTFLIPFVSPILFALPLEMGLHKHLWLRLYSASPILFSLYVLNIAGLKSMFLNYFEFIYRVWC